MFEKLNWLALAILALALLGCDIRTPEIRGLVLDEETKQPIENAWVHSSIETKTKTIQGPVQTVWRVAPAHTRTNKKGEFVIPPQKIEKPTFPYGLGTEIENFSISVSTIDDKSGGMYLKEYEGKGTIETKLYVKPWEGINNEGEYFSYLQSLFNYCLNGRFGIEHPKFEDECDLWELNFAITKHERYLEIFKKIVEERGYSKILDQLSELYEKKGDLKKSIQMLEKSIEVMDKRGLLKFENWQKIKNNIENKIEQKRKQIKE